MEEVQDISCFMLGATIALGNAGGDTFFNNCGAAAAAAAGRPNLPSIHLLSHVRTHNFMHTRNNTYLFASEMASWSYKLGSIRQM